MNSNGNPDIPLLPMTPVTDRDAATGAVVEEGGMSDVPLHQDHFESRTTTTPTVSLPGGASLLLLASLPRSIRWRIQLGLYVRDGGGDGEDTVVLSDTAAGGVAAWLTTVEECNKDTIQQHQDRFQRLMEEYVEKEEEEEVAKAEQEQIATPTAPALDPLTAMVQEQEAEEQHKAEIYLRYRKERVRRKRGLTVADPSKPSSAEEDTDEGGFDQATLKIIEKDLNRLPHPSGTPASPEKPTAQHEERQTTLREILYIYSQEHPSMGYRQGMHEIASYLLHVLEIEQSEHLDHPLLFDPIMPICFAMLEQVLEQLQLAYDASGEEALQRMSESILGKIQQNDPILYNLLAKNPHIPPPPIYCTRWVRLLFSREVVGCQNVLKLWDSFFASPNNLMRVLEVCSSARILLLRNALLSPEHYSPLDLLMNVPPMQDITPLTDLLKQLLSQSDTDPPLSFPSTNYATTASGFSEVPSFPPQSPIMSVSSKDKFSFSKLKSSLGQKGESLRKKIVTSTNEWKQQQNMTDNASPSASSGQLLPGTSNSDQPIRAAATQQDLLRQVVTAAETGISTSGGNVGGFFQAAGDAIWNPQALFQAQGNIGDLGVASSVAAVMPQPPSPQQYQHEMWAQLMKDRIWTIQESLMQIETAAVASAETDASGSEQPQKMIPQNVWEALADLDKMQHELHNYSKNIANRRL